jgi:dTDP-4-amino-4,6-dideoxygalactose transaminase
VNIQRTLPPAAAEVNTAALLRAAVGIVGGARYIRRAQAQLKEYFGVDYVFLTSSGACALTLILRALRSLTGRREVVIPAYTCFSVPAAVVRAGLHVRVCDIDPTTLDFDYRRLDGAITRDTLCVVPTHLFGLPSDVDRVARIARTVGTFVVEDAAQAMGGRNGSRLLGTIGDVGFFSLARGKTITCGSGGVVVTSSRRIGQAIARQYDAVREATVGEAFRDFARLLLMRAFLHPCLFWLPKAVPRLQLGRTRYDVGFPMTRLSGVNAGALHGWQARLARTLRLRAESAAYFCAALGLQAARAHAAPARLPVVMDSREARDRLYALSERRGLGLGVMYPTAIHAIDELKTSVGGQRAPAAELVAERLLTIPTHHLVSATDRRAVCDLVREGWRTRVAA